MGFLFGVIAGSSLSYGVGSSQRIGTTLLIGLLSAIPFGLIGGGLGSIFAEDQLYDLSNLNPEAKRKTIQYLMKEYSDK